LHCYSGTYLPSVCVSYSLFVNQHPTTDRPFSLEAVAKDGNLTLEIPPTYRGPLTIQSNRNVHISPGLMPLFCTFSEIDGFQKCFVGNAKEAGFGSCSPYSVAPSLNFYRIWRVAWIFNRPLVEEPQGHCSIRGEEVVLGSLEILSHESPSLVQSASFACGRSVDLGVGTGKSVR